MELIANGVCFFLLVWLIAAVSKIKPLFAVIKLMALAWVIAWVINLFSYVKKMLSF